MPETWKPLERPPWPLWLLVSVALDKHRDEGLSVSECARVVRELSHGSYCRLQTVSAALSSMRGAGFATFTLRKKKARKPAKVHRLTARGEARLFQAVQDICDAYAHLGVRLA